MPRRQLSPARPPRSNPWHHRCPANDLFAQRSASSGTVGSKAAWNLVPWSPSEIGALSFLETPPPFGFRRALEGRALLHTRTNGWKFPLFVNALRVPPKSKGVQSRHGAVTRMGADRTGSGAGPRGDRKGSRRTWPARCSSIGWRGRPKMNSERIAEIPAESMVGVVGRDPYLARGAVNSSLSPPTTFFNHLYSRNRLCPVDASVSVGRSPPTSARSASG